MMKYRHVEVKQEPDQFKAQKSHLIEQDTYQGEEVGVTIFQAATVGIKVRMCHFIPISCIGLTVDGNKS